MRFFLDTNIIIYALKNTFPALQDHFLRVPAQSIAIPTAVLAEIEYGARKSSDYLTTIRRYRAFTDTFDPVGFDEAAATHYGQIRAELERDGKLIGANDLIIAATVRSQGGILVTHNTREFERVPQLLIEDWTV